MTKPAKANVREDVKSLTGPERAAVLLLSLGDEHGAPIWKVLDDEEVTEVSQVMANLGTVSSSLIEKLLVDWPPAKAAAWTPSRGAAAQQRG